MYPTSKYNQENQENTSTPKRRRLGVAGPNKIWRANSLQISGNTSICVPKRRDSCASDKNDDDPLPCNQIEYLDSAENSATSIPCSPGVDCSILKNIENWESLVVSTKLSNVPEDNSATVSKELCDIEDITDDMFMSRLEQEQSQMKQTNNTLLTSNCEKHFREYIEESFDVVNQSICNLPKEDNVNKSSLFDTKDSFLLDIGDTGKVLEEVKNKSNASKPMVKQYHDNNTFYGLPLIAKGLFKSYRNIEKFYDWQEECLNLDAIRERRNLIYALPTSGGKTLVAEVLMLKEVLNRRKNALFILPFVAIVQEKIWSLSPFAVQLDFLIEEYAGGKGHIPPKKRRKKNSIYIATIEKGLALVRSLIELDRLGEIGLVVVDELHLIGEPGRGGVLESMLATILFTKKDIQIVGMSATIGNLPDLARFIHAEVYERSFRPVELTEYVKLGTTLHRLVWGSDGLEVVPERQLAFDYTAAGASLDPDFLGGLVSEVVPQDSCLVFCPTKRNCENVATLLSKLQRREMLLHRTQERKALEAALRMEGSSDLCRLVRCGVAYHHAGIAGEERLLLEQAFRSGVISVICCTSTLAAGVNLPARRVVLRAPYVGRAPLGLAAYRQMAGRAARAGLSDKGESIIICSERDWPQLRCVLSGGLAPVRSVLAGNEHEAGAINGLILSAVALKLATNRPKLRELFQCTLLATEETEDGSRNLSQLCDASLRSLIVEGALQVASAGAGAEADAGECVLYNDTELALTPLGHAAYKGCMDVTSARALLSSVRVAARALVCGALHLLYLVAPARDVRPSYHHYYTLYSSLDEEGVLTARALGITENNAVQMITGKQIKNVPEKVLHRFYIALMLRDLWREMSVQDVACKYQFGAGAVQALLSESTSLARAAAGVCEADPGLWAFCALFADLAARMRACATPQLRDLMDLPHVQKARALQLVKAGYRRVEDVAKASADRLVSAVSHLSRRAANQLISSARMLLIEKVENLRAEAEEVMEELNS